MRIFRCPKCGVVSEHDTASSRYHMECGVWCDVVQDVPTKYAGLSLRQTLRNGEELFEGVDWFKDLTEEVDENDAALDPAEAN